ncbi:MAG: GNAT family N-acetyltransferase [Solirubrobacterales bacterium]
MSETSAGPARPETVPLRDGSSLRIRAIRPEDKGAIAEGFERMSPASRYRRFFAPLRELSEDDLAYLTEVDHHDHEALIGFDVETRDPVGVARYIRSLEPTEAEVAVTVIDDWQGRGAATALLEHLVRRAREAGIEHFVAAVLPDNRDALELFRHLAPDGSTERHTTSGLVEFLIEVPETPRPGELPPESALARALRGAAHSALEINPWRLIRRRIHR